MWPLSLINEAAEAPNVGILTIQSPQPREQPLFCVRYPAPGFSWPPGHQWPARWATKTVFSELCPKISRHQVQHVKACQGLRISELLMGCHHEWNLSQLLIYIMNHHHHHHQHHHQQQQQTSFLGSHVFEPLLSRRSCRSSSSAKGRCSGSWPRKTVEKPNGARWKTSCSLWRNAIICLPEICGEIHRFPGSWSFCFAIHQKGMLCRFCMVQGHCNSQPKRLKSWDPHPCREVCQVDRMSFATQNCLWCTWEEWHVWLGISIHVSFPCHSIILSPVLNSLSSIWSSKRSLISQDNPG